MSQFSWIDRPVAAELGAIAHGPRLLSESSGLRVGLRLVVAYRHVMDVSLAVSASGSRSADLANQFRVTRVPGEALSVAMDRRSGLTAWVVSPELHMDLTGSTRNPHTIEGHYIREFSYVIHGRPNGTTLEIEYSWPDIGLEPVRVVLTIPSTQTLNASIVRL